MALVMLGECGGRRQHERRRGCGSEKQLHK
jgi:hypothetical protein